MSIVAFFVQGRAQGTTSESGPSPGVEEPPKLLNVRGRRDKDPEELIQR